MSLLFQQKQETRYLLDAPNMNHQKGLPIFSADFSILPPTQEKKKSNK